MPTTPVPQVCLLLLLILWFIYWGSWWSFGSSHTGFILLSMANQSWSLNWSLDPARICSLAALVALEPEARGPWIMLSLSFNVAAEYISGSSELRSVDCFSRGSELGSQHPCWVAHNCSSENLKPSSRLLGHPHSWAHSYTQPQTHTCNFKKK